MMYMHRIDRALWPFMGDICVRSPDVSALMWKGWQDFDIAQRHRAAHNWVYFKKATAEIYRASQRPRKDVSLSHQRSHHSWTTQPIWALSDWINLRDLKALAHKWVMGHIREPSFLPTLQQTYMVESTNSQF